MPRWNRIWSSVLAAGLLAGLVACGGDGPTNVTPPPPPPPTPPPPVVVSQIQGFALRAGFASFANFSTTSTGTLEATVDWTFATNDLDVYLTPSTCTFAQLAANQCTMIAFSESETAKPEKARATNVAPGNYIIWIHNVGPADDTLSYQVVFSGNATGAGGVSAASQSAAGSAAFAKTRPVGLVESH
jgi:hypothetical protein